MKKEMKNQLLCSLVYLSLMILFSFSYAFNVSAQDGESGNLTMLQAKSCIEDSVNYGNELALAGFNMYRVNDTIILAKEKYEAQIVLMKQNMPYDFSKVLDYCKEIKNIMDLAFSAKDEFSLLKEFYNDSIMEEMDTTEIDGLILQIDNEIKSERYERVDMLVQKGYDEISSLKSEYTTANLVYNTARDTLSHFIINNWMIILIFLSSGIILLFIFKKRIEIHLIKNKINNLEKRKITLKKLIQDTQRNYFENGNMSENLYNIRTKKFAEIVRDIDRQIPLLEEELARLTRGIKIRK
jgi:hypothetical protein